MIDSMAQSGVTQPLIDVLEQLANVVARLPDSNYSQKPVGVVQSSVGAHVRHCLDHVRTLIDAIETGELSYDDRRRGTSVETSPRVACGMVDAIIGELTLLDADGLDRPIQLLSTLSPDAPAIRVQSSVGRELVYVLAHTIHHNALISAMVKTLGGWLPDRFGYAPSTVKHMEQACAR